MMSLTLPVLAIDPDLTLEAMVLDAFWTGDE
ncbi:hypothetical protein FHR72_000897 [Mycolicibacterium iranicum]|uniref:Uncharacterized protein n=1 Tax=Mycolicibacterium iranicum TaxID=912594 RepID=A0A839Q3E1_MYCIR|nr:hypothetical protein [Mycolicibacterium iranicum]